MVRKNKFAASWLKYVALGALTASVLLLSSCDSGPDLPVVDPTLGGQTTDSTSADDVVTEYVPVMDDDADRIDGIAIKSAEELAKIGVDSDYPLNGDYVLVIDIDLSECGTWTPIGTSAESGASSGAGIFTGTFDGRNHVISGLTIEESAQYDSFWGLFGSVGSKNKKKPAVIKNVVLKDVNITLYSNAATGVGALAGQVSGFAEISGISLLSGDVAFSGSGSLGVGGMIGQCRTKKTSAVSNNGISIENVFSNITVTAENGYWNTCGGVIGRIRDSALGNFRYVISVATAKFEGNLTYAMASGDYTAKKMSNLYFLEKTGVSRDNMGESMSSAKLRDGTLSMSGSWSVTSGIYPMISEVIERPGFTVLDLTNISFSGSENETKVKSNFRLPTTAAGLKVQWTSDNTDVISISGANATVKQPESGYVDVKLTAVSGSYTKIYTMRVVASQRGYFITEYVKAGEPIELGGFAEGCTFKWTVKNAVTGAKRVEKTTEPRFTVTKKDVESLITVEADGYDEISIYYSYLPIMYIDCGKKYSSIGKSSYADAEMRLCASEEYEDLLYSGDIGIKLRGNSTSRLSKKPFKIKLDTKANLLGIDEEGKNKHWCLMANALDPTLMRNVLIQDFSKAIGTEVSMGSQNIVLIYNGDYYGVYQLTEHVRVDKTRVDIFNWGKYAEKAAETIAAEKQKADGLGNAETTKLENALLEKMTDDWSWMSTGSVTLDGVTYVFTDWGLDQLPEQTGGFLLEMDFYSQSDFSLAKTETAYDQPLYFNTPEPVGVGLESFMTTPLYNYAFNYVQSFEYAIHSNDFFFRNDDEHYNAVVYDRWNWTYEKANYVDNVNDGLHYSQMFDMDNLVNNFIFCEMIMNWDSMKNSFFVYKDIDGLAYIGPQWDFDWAWGNVLWNGNTWRPTEWHCRCYDFMIEQYYQEEQWNCLLIRDPYFLVKVWERWQKLRDDEIEALVGNGGIMDSYIGYMRDAALANDAKWSSQVAYGFTFDSETYRMKEFVNTRMEWLDEQFVSVESLVNSLGVYHASELLDVEKVDNGTSKTEITVSVNDSDIKYIMLQINGTTMKEVKVTGSKVTVSIDNSELDSDGYNCITVYAENSVHDYIIDEDRSDHGNYDTVVSDFCYFKLK